MPSRRRRKYERDPIGDALHEGALRALEEFAAQAESDEAFAAGAEELVRTTPELMRQELEATARRHADAIERQSARLLRRRRRQRAGFERRLAETWREGLDRLEVLTQCYYDFGLDYVSDGLSNEAITDRHKFTALAGLHARASRVAMEILALLRAGLPDGAHARWRTLHELSVIVQFLAAHDELTAERYLRHEAIRSYRGATALQQHHQALRWDAVDAAELEGLAQEVAALKAQFGDVFATDYGWAALAFGGKRPTFASLEQMVSLEHWRPLYSWASEGVHGGPAGLHPLGLERDGPPFLLAGPTNAGLADPGQNTVISLTFILAAMATHHPTATRLTMLQAFEQLAHRCIQGFMEGHDRVEALKQLGPFPQEEG